MARVGALPVGSQSRVRVTSRALGADRLLAWLETFPGDTWGERWEASGVEDAQGHWTDAAVQFVVQSASQPLSLSGARRVCGFGLDALLSLGVLRPGIAFLIRGRLKQAYVHVREMTDPELYARAEAYGRRTGARERHLADSLNHLARVTMNTGLPPQDMTPAHLVEYHRVVSQLVNARSLVLAFDMLRETGVFPPGTPPLRSHLHRGQRTVAELVDMYQVQCAPVREVLVRYLSERAPAIDYNSVVELVGHLVLTFWRDLEKHHPGIDSLHLSPEAAAAWRERARMRKNADGTMTPRSNPYAVLFVVRAFYLDIAQWAVEDPYWARWAAPSPVRRVDVRGSTRNFRQRQARMHQRTRVLAPLLPQLVHSVEARLRWAERLHAAVADAAVGSVFSVDGERYERVAAGVDALKGGRAGAGRLRVRRLADDALLDVTREEDEAFWTWAIVETLRHTGVRVEELLELTHLALVRHTLPDTGEVVPLLQIAPSKQDTERVLLVSPELAHVLARIVHRVRGGADHIPLVSRYDIHERVTGPPLPHLFQRHHGNDRRAMGSSTPGILIRQAVERLGLHGPDGQLLHYTPHDFRRIFATEAVSGGIPVHIAAKLLGHEDLNTTQTYVAVYQDDVVRHHAAFIARRRAERPGDEYREPTAVEWAEFDRHFTRRKVELGTCVRPYGTPCRHEHACLRCPALQPDPAQALRLAEIITNLHERLREAHDRGWLGEVEGLQVSLAGARQKLRQMRKLRQATIPLGPTRHS
ncbi:tyrosine-type recombinase/integrase [Streptodolium elevatio]|uniref:Site-specific integrase n=1 Tax=Streptodolium elevatio TaxID=3157996 RepID=A0ABV3DUX9_9ACTN